MGEVGGGGFALLILREGWKSVEETVRAGLSKVAAAGGASPFCQQSPANIDAKVAAGGDSWFFSGWLSSYSARDVLVLQAGFTASVLLAGLVSWFLAKKRWLGRVRKVTRRSLAQVREERQKRRVDQSSDLRLTEEAMHDERMPLAGLDEYFDSLRLGGLGQVTKAEVLASLFSATGKSYMLPALMLLPEGWRTPPDAVVGSGGRIAVLKALSSNILSPVMIGAMTDFGVEASRSHVEKVRVVAADDQYSQQEGATPGVMESGQTLDTKAMIKGPMAPLFDTGDNQKPPLPSLPNPFVMEKDYASILDAMVGDSPADSMDELPAHLLAPHMLPGLYKGNKGAGHQLTLRQRAACRLFAAVLNRLASNSVPALVREEVLGRERSEKEETFAIMLGGLHYTTVDDILKALAEAGHRLDVRIMAKTTSFGLGFSFEDEGRIVQVPLAFVYKTGIRTRPSAAGHTRGPQQSIRSIFPHCYLSVEVEGPVVAANIQAYQGVEGYNGWFSAALPDLPWANSKSAIRSCEMPPFTREEGLEAARLAALNSIVCNAVASRGGLLMGGYGSLSTCIDATAIIEYAVRGSTSLFPIMLQGSFRALLVDMASELAGAPDTAATDAQGFRRLRAAYINLPSDISIGPKETEDACRRLLASLPGSSPFEIVRHTAMEAQEALEYVRNKGYGKEVEVGV